MVPLYRSYAKNLDAERKALEKAYKEPLEEFKKKLVQSSMH